MAGWLHLNGTDYQLADGVPIRLVQERLERLVANDDAIANFDVVLHAHVRELHVISRGLVAAAAWDDDAVAPE